MYLLKEQNLIIFTLITQCLALGSIELNLISFRNEESRLDDGTCCSDGIYQQKCNGPCKTFFRACLKQFESKINVNSSCTFGEIITPVLGSNSIQFDRNSQMSSYTNPIRFPFNFSWPGMFTIIVEAWHETSHSGSTFNQEEKKLITRYSSSRVQKVNVIPTDKYQRSNYTELVYSYRVLCDTNHYGEQCTVFCKPRDDSFGHYTCAPATGDRECLSGWTGKFCTEPVCSSGCSKEHGYCARPNECKCKYGWSGSNCTECQRYPGCVNGECDKPWECKCKSNWGGLLCNQDLNYCATHSPCKNGVCSNAGPGSYNCICPPNFLGKNCEIEVSRCEELNPCQNNGVCKTLNSLQNYTCICPNNYHGKHCELTLDTCASKQCRNEGSCIDGPSGPLCLCKSGFFGDQCEHTKQTDCSPNPCYNGGQCNLSTNNANNNSNFTCTCKADYFGTLCELRTTSSSSLSDYHYKTEHKSKIIITTTTKLLNSANQLPSTLESRPTAERLNSEQLILISIVSLIVPSSALLIYVFLRYIKKPNLLSNNNNGLPCKSINEIEVIRQNETNKNLLNNSSTLNNNNSSNFNSTKLSKTAPGANVIVNSLHKASSVYSLNKAKSTMKLNNLNQLNNENIYTKYPVNNNTNTYATQLRQHPIYSTLNNVNRHSMYGMISSSGSGGLNKASLSTFVTPQNFKFNQQSYATIKKSTNNHLNTDQQINNQLNHLNNQLNQPTQKSIYETVQYGQIKPDPNYIYSTKQSALVYNIPPPNKVDKF